ncbi:hypothetical protein L1987_15775 [Smallanthus sonchifolius]|uniref:Uncharacterized protein n=1 Tax=Smallanthus sonchifolius TaxID=185202 RepID=A0ACB9J9Z7_9ASTR|nr:hypothetical protein L1987_15775 [Smallanthus sonchifolius]
MQSGEIELQYHACICGGVKVTTNGLRGSGLVTRAAMATGLVCRVDGRCWEGAKGLVAGLDFGTGVGVSFGVVWVVEEACFGGGTAMGAVVGARRR